MDYEFPAERIHQLTTRYTEKNKVSMSEKWFF